MQPSGTYTTLLYHFCRLRLSRLNVSFPSFVNHLTRAFTLFREKQKAAGDTHPEEQGPGNEAGAKVGWETFVQSLHALDWFLACACLEGQSEAWEILFAARANRTDTLLVDALRSRAVRLFPRDESRQEQAVAEFWGYLLAGEREGSLPILARYDGQRPLIPWLIRVFQNKILSERRDGKNLQPLPEDDLNETPTMAPEPGLERWHDEFRVAARDWFQSLNEEEVLLLGLRLRYRISQREVASLLGIHEGNISRRIQKIRDRCLEQIGQALTALGWIGEDLTGFLLKEMDSLLLDEPRLSANALAALLAARGKSRGANGGFDDVGGSKNQQGPEGSSSPQHHRTPRSKGSRPEPG